MMLVDALGGVGPVDPKSATPLLRQEAFGMYMPRSMRTCKSNCRGKGANTMSMTATYSPEDNKRRLYSTSRLDNDLYNRVKA
jgi:hypothetical protein